MASQIRNVIIRVGSAYPAMRILPTKIAFGQHKWNECGTEYCAHCNYNRLDSGEWLLFARDTENDKEIIIPMSKIVKWNQLDPRGKIYKSMREYVPDL